MPNQNTYKTHCVSGHELTEENTYRRRGKRECCRCRAIACKRWRFRTGSITKLQTGNLLVARYGQREPREIIKVVKNDHVVARGTRTDRVPWNNLHRYMIVPPREDVRWVSRSESMVENAPLRKAFQDSGESSVDVCWRLGLTEMRNGRRYASPARLTRALGMSYETSNGRRTVRASLSIDRARAICDAIGVDFDELYPVLTTGDNAGTCKGCDAELLIEADYCGFCLKDLEEVTA
jgi:hypothetical protein